MVISPWFYLFFCYLIMVCQDSQVKVTKNLKSFLWKYVVSNKKQILSATIEKIKICLFKKTALLYTQKTVPSDYKLCIQVGKKLQWGHVKQKPLWKVNQAYSRILQAYSEPWHIENQRYNQSPDIFRILAYWEPEAYLELWYIQNPGMFRTLSYWEPKTRDHLYKQFWCLLDSTKNSIFELSFRILF